MCSEDGEQLEACIKRIGRMKFKALPTAERNTLLAKALANLREGKHERAHAVDGKFEVDPPIDLDIVTLEDMHLERIPNGIIYFLF